MNVYGGHLEMYLTSIQALLLQTCFPAIIGSPSPGMINTKKLDHAKKQWKNKPNPLHP